MPANPGIALQGRSIDTATPIRQAVQDQQSQEMNHEKILQEHYATLDAREKSRLTSTVAGAAQLKTFLDRDDLEGAHNFLLQRRQSIQGRMANGENLDTEETDAALDMLRTGKIDELKNGVHSLMAAGQVYGILHKNDQPSNIQEWQQYNAMPPEDQKRYLQMKRANQVVDQGNQHTVIDPTGAPVTSYPTQLKPGEEPAVRQEQATATAIGTKAGERAAAGQQAEFNERISRNYLTQALKVLPQATGGLVQQGVTGTAKAAGVSTDSSKADKKLSILAGKLTGMVPRFEGPQGVRDVELYQEMAGDLANTSLPVGDREAAAQMMLDLLDEYGPQGAGTGGTGKMVVVVGPDGEFEIPEEDLQAAQQDGYKVK